ncbi:hypothetical protein [Magnetococcus marinus]|uniref:hypothetical protein n=1 Tax=Magnetococcus marinus TaxID=1124597 RepID=UPI0003243F2C|nr:hypothetical protein [Magnetococcus marinus]
MRHYAGNRLEKTLRLAHIRALICPLERENRDKDLFVLHLTTAFGRHGFVIHAWLCAEFCGITHPLSTHANGTGQYDTPPRSGISRDPFDAGEQRYSQNSANGYPSTGHNSANGYPPSTGHNKPRFT